MELRQTVERGVGFARSGPGGAAVTAAICLLTIDLLLKLLGVSILHFSIPIPFLDATLAGGLGGTLPFSRLATYLWTGLVIGLVIGLASIGLSLTYSILNFANFAHGDYLTAGAFSGWAAVYAIAGFGSLDIVNLVLLHAPPGDVGANILKTPLAIVVGLVVAVVFTLALSVVIDRLVYKPMRNADGISLLIASIGVAFALRYLLALVFGSSRRIIPDQNSLPKTEIAGVIVNAHDVTLVVVALLLMVGLHVLLQRTKLGKAMRAMADNRDLARVTGIPSERVIRVTWLIGAGLTGAAGFLFVLSQNGLGFQTGWRLLLLIFAAVIMGGIGSIYGAITGGIVIGLASRVSLVWLQGDYASFARPTAFLLMILILLFRPSGIFGGVKTA